MAMDFIQFRNTSGEWGVTTMMRRIEEIERRFGPKIPMSRAADGAQFQQLLEDNMQETAPGIVKEGSGRESQLFAPGTFAEAVNKDNKYEDIITKASDKYNIDRKLLEAVIRQESNFNPAAVSSKGAMGLMQLMPDTAKDLKVTNPFDPEQNVDGGARYLRAMMDQFDGNTEKALSAYNAGPKAVQTYKGVPPYAETKQYVERIMNMLSEG